MIQSYHNAIHEEVEDEAEVAGESGPDYLPLYRIASFGADFDVQGLVSRLDTDDIQVPSFQRGFVWTFRQAARFVESLLLGFPVPGIFLWRDPASEKLVVVDGQQRLRTLQGFRHGQIRDRVFRIPKAVTTYQEVHPRFIGKTYRTLDAEDRRRLDNSIIHATIVSQERPLDDYSSIFYLFERINTEGTPLQPQEIRTTVFRGPFIQLLEEANKRDSWRMVYGKPSPRMKDRELILRFLALFHNSKNYERPMKEFLNRFASAHRHATETELAGFEELFVSTANAIAEAVGTEAFRPVKALNAAVYDAVMVGLARRLQKGALDPATVRQAYQELLHREDFLAACTSGTADKKAVDVRLAIATGAFSKLG